MIEELVQRLKASLEEPCTRRPVASMSPLIPSPGAERWLVVLQPGAPQTVPSTRSASSGSRSGRPGSYSRVSLRPIVGTKSDATYWGQRIAPLQRKRMFVPFAASKERAWLEYRPALT